MQKMDKSDYPLLTTSNGFEIRENNNWDYKFRVFHPNFEGVYIDDFVSLAKAEEFCAGENVDDWKKALLEI